MDGKLLGLFALKIFQVTTIFERVDIMEKVKFESSLEIL